MSNRTPIVIGNWKMHGTIHDALRLLTELKGLLSGKQEVEVVVAPDFVALHPAGIALQDSSIRIAAQNMHWEESGAFTGEVSALMLVEVGCSHVILGHSERRRYSHETDHEIRQKYKMALDQDLIPIVCVGETAEERQQNRTNMVIERQLYEILFGVGPVSGRDFIVAYEPVWAIGTGKNATPEQAQEVHALIRQQVRSLYRGDIGEQVRVVYGGSVTPENVEGLVKMPDVDGVLVGSASVDARAFAKIVGLCDNPAD